MYYIVLYVGLFSGPALDRVSNIDEIIVSNSVAIRPEVLNNKQIKQLSIAPLLAESIRRVYENKTLHKLFTLPTAAQQLAIEESSNHKHTTIHRDS